MKGRRRGRGAGRRVEVQAGAALVVGAHKETRMCSEQTCLSRFVIEGQQGGKQPLCPGSTKSVRACDTAGVCARPCASLCVMDACVHLIILLIAHSGINIPYRETRCKVNLSVCLSSRRGVCICVAESKAFDPNLCVCIIYSLIPASLCLFFKAGLRS